jgi:transmembrane sensor
MTPAADSHDASPQHEALLDWFLRRHAAPWTEADERAFQHWLDADRGNRDAYARWEADWALIERMPQDAADRLRAMVAADRAKEAAPARRAQLAPRRRALVSRFAMAGLAAMAVGGGWFGWAQWQAQPVYEQAFETARGRQSEVRLPDGSTLHLDAATSLKVVFFRGRREVRMAEGQALFTVQANAARPFRVEAGGVRVTVVGTRFSVRSTPAVPGREATEVAVAHGKVRVARTADDDATAAPPFDLVAGQRVVMGALPTLGTIAADSVAPRQGAPLSFSNTPLAGALAEMARHADLGIVAVDPAVANLRLTGTFDPRDAAATRRLLASALPVQLVPGHRGFEVRPAR